MAAMDVSLESISVLCCPWIRFRTFCIPDRGLVIARRTHEIYADRGMSTQYMGHQLSVLDTGATPNLINFENVPPALWAHMCCGPALDIIDANNNPLQPVGYLPLVVRLGTCMVQQFFVVCNTLAAPVILGCDFCDRFVEAIRPRAKTV